MDHALPTVKPASVPTSAPVRARLAALRFVGQFTEADAQVRSARLIDTQHGADHAPGHIRLTLLVDAAGTVLDVRFRSNASGDLLAAYDAMAELVAGRRLAETRDVSPARVEAHLRGGGAESAFPLAADADQPFVILAKAIEAAEPRRDAPRTPDQLPWGEVGLFEKVRRIEAVLDQHVRPALASDGGGIDLVDLKDDELFVQYSGACGSCSSSIGGTLNFVQDALNNHLGVVLTVQVTQVELEESPAFGL
jgi:NifU-like protein